MNNMERGISLSQEKEKEPQEIEEKIINELVDNEDSLKSNSRNSKRDYQKEHTDKIINLKSIYPRREDESDKKYEGRINQYFFNLQMSDLRMAHNPELRKIDKTLLDKLTLPEKTSLIEFCNHNFFHKLRLYPPDISGFAKKYGLEGLKTFLACEYGMNMGDAIIDLGKKLPQEQAEKLFSKYKEIVDEADKVLEMVKGFNKEIDSEIENKIKENLLRKGKDLLFSFHQKLIRGEKIEKMEEDLENIKSDIILFASTFKTLSGAKEKVNLNEITKTVMETKKPENLSSAEKDEMVRIFMANRETDYSEKLLEEVFNDFEKSINPEENSLKAKAEFKILKYNNQIVSFMRLESRGKDRVYAAAFNTRPEAKGFSIGNAMMKEIIDKTAEEKVIEAVAYSKKPELLNFYENFFSFNPVGEIEIAGEKFIKLERNDIGQNQELSEAA